ncbi:MAG TPA: orotate phosphoribosyltransferase [Saprospiraceae bacterium]|nr:MAG: orotate phosphoribosyltransferase [Candidatus Parvibacillus calidus]MCC7149305.1 orotate phosphoribosyltransferase [Saprospiraceae bacterium]MBK7739238.1 orotate phosphoribosyltransferase [Candidatus Parvibacillus calidus]WKZ63170.1 MAG: orotate phosphoribosyltransferase [Saprospiraceae bacterium]HRN33449.1 orotate phosphoribosyltransferase [Saprospiraceae bacterium]
MVDYKKAVAKKLLQINAINLNYNQPFTWASGIISPIYCDNRKSLSDIDARNLICEGFVAESERFGTFDVVAGVATGGIAHGMLVADRLGLPFIYVRTSAKGHGLKNSVEGKLNAGQRVMVIEDLISTGGSSFHAIESLREAGAVISGMMAIFTYGFNDAVELFANHEIKVSALTDYDTLIDVAKEMHIIEEDQIAGLMEWKKSPREWRI